MKFDHEGRLPKRLADMGSIGSVQPGVRKKGRTSWPDGFGMVYMGMSPWNSMWKSRHQLMSRFATCMPVLYAEPAKTLRDCRSGKYPISQYWSDWQSHRLRREKDNLSVFTSPVYMPVSGSRLLGPPTRKIWLSAIRRSARSCGIDYPILWVSLPSMLYAVGKLGEVMSIYHVVDEYTGYTGLTEAGRKRLADQENMLLDSVDHVIVASPELEKAKNASGRNVLIMENGVDTQAFGEAREKGRTPDDLQKIQSPRIGYCGLIGKRLDLDLLFQVAQSLPDCSLVLIGKIDSRECESDLSTLKSLPNVYFLGQKEPRQVPDYIVGLDVGLLPYALNTETFHISPLKMYEYMAAGIPTVSTDIPAARRQEDLVTVVKDGTEFVAECARALRSDSIEARDERIAQTVTHDWNNRVQEISTHILKGLSDLEHPG